jgi:hypothetical protein
MSGLDQVSGSRDFGISLGGELLQHGKEPLGFRPQLSGSISFLPAHARKTALVAMAFPVEPATAPSAVEIAELDLDTRVYVGGMRDDLSRMWRREYLRRHAQTRRVENRNGGARRIDITLEGKDLDNYEAVRGWLEELNRTIGSSPNKIIRPLPFRLSAAEVIKEALKRAASAIIEEQSPRMPAERISGFDDRS